MAPNLAEAMENSMLAKPEVSINHSEDRINGAMRTALINLKIGVIFGLGLVALCIWPDYEPVQSSLYANMFGWLSLCLAGGLYLVFPSVAKGWLPHLHCWLIATSSFLLVLAVIGISF